MAYTAYRTWTTGEIVTAALMNEQVKDNGLLTAPAIMTGQGDLIYGSAANTPARLAKDANSTRSLTNTGTNNNPAWAQVALATGVSGTLPVGNGGTGATTLTANGALIGNGTSAIASVDMSTKGGLLAGDGSGNPSVLAVGGSNDHVLTVDSGETTGMKWAAASGTTINNNADNRVITGSGTANTLNGEANLTFDGTDLTVGAGNVIIGTAGKGIDFSAQTATSTGTAVSEVLDHYEEGTWTPILRTHAHNTATQSIQVGRYTRIGDTVFFQCAISSSDISGLTGSDGAYVYGLPFTTTSATNQEGNVYSGNGYSLAITAGSSVSGNIPTNHTRIALQVWSATTGTHASGLTATQWSAGGNMRLSGHFYV